MTFCGLALTGWWLNYKAKTFYPSIFHSCAVIAGAIGMFISSMQVLIMSLIDYFRS